MKRLYRLCFPAACLLLFSCQPQHYALTHNTPHFTEGNQFEGGAGIDVFGGGSCLNMAYTPFRYFAIQATGYNYPGFPGQPRYYSNFAEAALGAYLPLRNSVLAVNTGFGLGNSNWRLRSVAGYSGYTMNEAKFDSRKFFVQVYWSYKNEESDKSYKGFSVKVNDFKDTYYSASAEAGSLTDYAKHLPPVISLEAIAFYKRRIYKKLFLDLNAGICGTNSDSEGGYLVGRIGLLIKP